MTPRRTLALVALTLALAAPAGAQEEGTWKITGSVQYVSHYEGRIVRGSLPFTLTTTVDAHGAYEVVIPACAAGQPPVVLTGASRRGSRSFLRPLVRDGIAADLVSCGNHDVRVGGLRVHQRLARDAQSLTGGFTGPVRYRFTGPDGPEATRARITGAYIGTRAAE